MARILLVESGVERPGSFVYQVYPPTGLMYLAAYLRQKDPGHELRLRDFLIERRPAPALADEVRNFRPDLIGIHAMSFQASHLLRLARVAKAARPKAKVIAGGPHPTIDPASVLLPGDVDAVVLGEGEATFAELVARLAQGQDLAEVPGTVVRRNGELVRGPERPFLENLDQLPFPAWDLIDPSRYFADRVLNQNDLRWRREVATLFTSRACPYGCIFCHNMFGKRFRGRSPENVLAEIELLAAEHGIREFHFIDDCFNLMPPRAKAILQGILDRGLDLKLAFPNGIRGDRLDDELLDLMKRAGTYKINFGIESGSRRIQKLIQKGLDLGVIEDAIARTAAAGIFTHGFFMLGFPGETEAEMRETIALACRSRLHTAGFALLSPFPGTRVRQMAEERGIAIAYRPEDTSYAQLSANLSAVDDAALLRLHREAHRRFYFRPGQLGRILRAMPRKSDLFRLARRHYRLKFV